MQLYMFVDMHLTIFDMQKILCTVLSERPIFLIHSDYQSNLIFVLIYFAAPHIYEVFDISF